MSASMPDTPVAQLDVVDESRAQRSLWGWSPPPLPANSSLERLVDRALPRTGIAAVLFYALVIAALNIAPHLARRAELTADGLVFLAAGGWCALNFWTCRHAHCVITAAGWLPLAAFTFGEALLGRTLIGGFEQAIFLAVLVVGIVFEVSWARGHGTNAIGRPAC